MISFASSLLVLLSSFLLESSEGLRVRTLISSSSNPDISSESDLKNPVKLPIIQVCRREELIGEFVCGSDLSFGIKKFNAFMLSLSRSESPAMKIISKEDYISWPVDNIYSDSLLLNELRSNEISIIKLFRLGCTKCIVST